MPGSAQTASRSASVHPPEKTAIRRNSRCSRSSRSEWLQSIVARSVCCRSGVSRGPDVRTSRAWSSRWSSTSGERSRNLAAASSSASGSPSRRRHRASTVASSVVGSARRCRGSSLPARQGAEQRRRQSRSRAGNKGSGYSRSAEILSGVRLVVTIRSSAQRSTSRATSGAAATICSRLSSSSSAFRSPISAGYPIVDRSSLGLLDVERFPERGKEVGGLGDIGHRHECDAVQELGCEHPAELHERCGSCRPRRGR